jgi:hypothetical protein
MVCVCLRVCVCLSSGYLYIEPHLCAYLFHPLSFYLHPGTPNGVYILKELGDKLLAIGGRYHWGLNFTQCIGATPLANMYPRFGDFQAQLNRANALGTYNNRYTKDLGLSADAGGKRRSLREQVCDEDQGNTNSSAKAGNDANAPLLMMQVN